MHAFDYLIFLKLFLGHAADAGSPKISVLGLDAAKATEFLETGLELGVR